MRVEGYQVISEKPLKEEICAVVVSHRPDADFPEQVARIADQVGYVVVVDNHSDDWAISMLDALSSQLNVHLILNDENLGVAAALNQGLSVAKERGYRWGLLFDQDTVPESFMVETLQSVYEDFPQKDRLAIIGSNYRDVNIQRVKYGPQPGETCSWIEKKTAITSGSLLSLAVFEVVGPFREELFIDYVDHEYCLRARSKGLKVILAREPLMRHALGAPTLHRLLWGKIGTSNYSPLRKYYMTRNHLAVAREYLFKEPRWVFDTSSSRTKSVILMLLFEGNRLSSMRYTLLGVWHGCVGKMGKL